MSEKSTKTNFSSDELKKKFVPYETSFNPHFETKGNFEEDYYQFKSQEEADKFEQALKDSH